MNIKSVSEYDIFYNCTFFILLCNIMEMKAVKNSPELFHHYLMANLVAIVQI